eukprot:822243-Rhodomonas_salina.2
MSGTEVSYALRRLLICSTSTPRSWIRKRPNSDMKGCKPRVPMPPLRGVRYCPSVSGEMCGTAIGMPLCVSGTDLAYQEREGPHARSEEPTEGMPLSLRHGRY